MDILFITFSSLQRLLGQNPVLRIGGAKVYNIPYILVLKCEALHFAKSKERRTSSAKAKYASDRITKS